MDYLTLIAIAFLAFALSMGIHEQLGHGMFCLIVGGRLDEISAYNYACGSHNLAEWLIRVSSISGLLANLISGGLGWFLLSRYQKAPSHIKYLLWLFGSISFFTAASNIIYSALTGMGDFGFEPEGLFYLLEPAGVIQPILLGLGITGYYFGFKYAKSLINRIIGGTGSERYTRAKTLLVTSYFSEILLAFFIGIFSPNGFLVFTSSSAASSILGALGLLLLLKFIDNATNSFAERLVISQNWWWVMAGFTSALLYALLIAPGVHF